MEGTCNAKARHGGRCRRPAGWGTCHKGRGPCRLHGGQLPNVIRHHAREQAIDFAREHLGSEIDDDPLEAMLQGVRIASGIVAFHSRKIELLDVVTPEDVRALEDANLNRQRVAEMAVRSGVAERLVHVTERMAEQLSLVFEEALGVVPLDAKTRQKVVDAFAAGVTRLEGQPIEGEARPLAA